MPKTLSDIEVFNRLQDKNLKLLGKYLGRKHLSTIQCFCGVVFQVRLHDVFNNHTRSCGCLYRNCQPVGPENVNWKGHFEISGTHLVRIKTSATKRNIAYDLTLEQLWNLFLKQNKKCALSGVTLTFSSKSSDSKGTTASLDRIDSSKGYFIDNVQWVHKRINEMKMSDSQKDFVNWCRVVSENN